MKCLFTNIQKQQNMLKSSLLFKNNANLMGYANSIDFGFNDTERGKLRFIQFSTRMTGWLLLTFLICLRNQLSSIIHSIIKY